MLKKRADGFWFTPFLIFINQPFLLKYCLIKKKSQMAPKIYQGITEIENPVSQLPHIVAHETNLTNQKKKKYSKEKNPTYWLLPLKNTKALSLSVQPCPQQDTIGPLPRRGAPHAPHPPLRRTHNIHPQHGLHFRCKEPRFQAARCSTITSPVSLCLLFYDATLWKQSNWDGRWVEVGISHYKA